MWRDNLRNRTHMMRLAELLSRVEALRTHSAIWAASSITKQACISSGHGISMPGWEDLSTKIHFGSAVATISILMFQIDPFHILTHQACWPSFIVSAYQALEEEVSSEMRFCSSRKQCTAIYMLSAAVSTKP